MTTPTPSNNTPSRHLPTFSSPAPRSVPPTGGTNMLSYDSPAMLNMLHDASSGMGGVGMGITMSGLGMSSLGMSASSMGRADEAERSRRLQKILEVIRKKPGRVSEQSLLFLCKVSGVPYEKHPDEPGTWILVIGDEGVCDVTFLNNEIENVKLQTNLDEERPELHFGATGSKILTKSLRPLPGQSKLNVTLERFSENLQKLLTMDKLGAPQNGGVSCYNAIAGVYASLRKLFEHEKKTDLATRSPDERHRNHRAEREVLCKKSGRPRLNGGSCLGLSLDYWMHRRHVIPHSLTTPSAILEDGDPDIHQVYSLSIECESSPSTLYTPIRISNDWISDAIEKPADANDAHASIDNILHNTPSIDWLDPKPTYLEPLAQVHDAIGLDSAAGRLPNIRFVAKFNPPLVVPLAVHIQLSQIVGIEPRTEDFRATTFVGLALRPAEVDPGMTNTTGEFTHEIRNSRSMLVIERAGKQFTRMHNTSLYVPTMEYSRTLESLPFSHPKQIVEILPVLRQYAATTAVLKDPFFEKGPKPPRFLPAPGGVWGPPPTPPPENPKITGPPLQVDVSLSYTPPTPRLTIHIPHPHTINENSEGSEACGSAILGRLFELLDSSCKPPLSVTVDVHVNGELVVSEQNLLSVPALKGSAEGAGEAEGKDADADADVDMDEAEKVEQKVKRLGKALDICGDVGVWGEWLRREVVQLEEGSDGEAGDNNTG
ncbi:uncharacterized protein K460DRAFT_284291 [Cucurbitaria berberidis CBS 394.84]|uniref:Mediator of RNA polymerase II transcription subunit 1 n=1 Tax=Cucurbitaria berberidis CBS 394.84 TaxID=1168544 RepID=A0A9P4GGJ3_9PLEO|nr:uncharacterized protein K460DRAFT_284291 [Cucurbitaria berberidis CBS 394.84]KAF1845039.1 hypothetical protein K460DRAFT_284291 [Cucurbitaria berberidis CBS 394.84]